MKYFNNIQIVVQDGIVFVNNNKVSNIKYIYFNNFYYFIFFYGVIFINIIYGKCLVQFVFGIFIRCYVDGK